MLLALGNFSCSGFLDEYPDSSIPEKEAMKTLSDCDAVVTGIYSAFKNGALYSGSLTQLPDIQADMAYAAGTNTGQLTEVYRWDIKPTNVEMESVYYGLYTVVSRCNFFMDYKDQVWATLTKQSDKDVFNKRLGDVYFARALANADLIRTFCEAYTEENADKENMGISIVTTYAEDEPQVKRSTLRQSYQQVLDDLDQAEKLIPAARAQADLHYFSPGVVHALRARVCLYMGDYKGAVEAATRVIASKTYEPADATYKAYLVNNVQLSEYELMWNYDSSKEIIWKVGMSATSSGGSLGRLFIGYNGASYNPQYLFAEEILKLYGDGDYRGSAFCKQQINIDGDAVYMITKYPGNLDLDAGGTRNFVNMPKPFRLSETYLIRAEAYYKLGEEEKANKDLSALLRKRIRNFDQSSAGGKDLLKLIQTQRACELFMEGFRLSDLKRWNLPIERKKQLYTMDGDKNNELKVLTSDARYRFTTWPIPKHEIEATNGVVVGNASNY